MIVVLIMGVVYKLAIVNLSRVDTSSKKINFLNLKNYLVSQKFTTSATLLCLDDCSTCKLLLDGNETAELKGFMSEDVQTYHYDALQGAIQKEMRVYFNKDDVEENVCFEYKVDSDGVGDQILVEDGESYYDFIDYFTDVKRYDSMETLLEHREDEASKVRG